MEIGNRMKLYEGLSASLPQLFPLLPAHARLDGKRFSKFTKGLDTPFDHRFSNLMVEVTIRLVEEFGACIGYTQSDEISLLWYSSEFKSQIPNNGRRDKMNTHIATFCSHEFYRLLHDYIPDKVNPKKIPQFDCRVWNTPTLEEAVNAFLWRELDATRNSIQGLGQAHFSHRELQNKNSEQIQDMLIQSKGINWNDMPAFAKRGTFVQKTKKKIKFTTDEIEKLPPKHAARKDPNLVMERSVINVISAPPIRQIGNKVGFLFSGEEPMRITEPSS